jgi:hypothetical protein
VVPHREERVPVVLLPLPAVRRTGTDFMNPRFGRKLCFGQIFVFKFWSKFYLKTTDIDLTDY